jgi:hypothetical protein
MRSILRSLAAMAVSPVITVPSSKMASSMTSSEVAGSIRPATRRTRLDTSMALRKLPVCSASAAKIRLPTVCPPISSEPS